MLHNVDGLVIYRRFGTTYRAIFKDQIFLDCWTIEDGTNRLSYNLDNLTMKLTNKMQLCRLIYYSQSALNVSSDVFVHHQEHLTYLQYLVVFTQVAAGWCHG